MLYDNIGDKNTETDMHFLRIQFAFEMDLISLFYKVYYYIRPGLGLQFVIVVFPNDIHLFFWSLVEKEYKCTTDGRHRKCPGDTVLLFVVVFLLFFFFCLKSHLTPPTPTL